jgi:hypothetical protein
MKMIVNAIILLVFFIWSPKLFAVETLYLWTDENEMLHITKAAPADSDRIIDIMEYEPQPVNETAAVPEPTKSREKDPLSDEKCRLAAEARRIAKDARMIAEAADKRAAEKRKQWQDLKNRVGYDDELIDDYKDDIRELENAARQAELFARQAEVQAREADLEARRAELEAGPDCRF